MNKYGITTSTEEEVIKGSKLNHLYSHDFEKGRFFQVVHEDGDGFEVKLTARTMFKAVYIKEKNDIEGIEFIKLVDGQEKQKIAFHKFNIAQAIAFLKFITTTDLKGISERRIKLSTNDLNEEAIKQIKTLLAQEGGQEVVESLINEGIITSRDIVNTAFRKRGLEIFRKLLEEDDFWKLYRNDIGHPLASEEKTWQYFFEKNEWIFGYGLDYRYLNVLQKEATVSGQDLDGKNSVVSDFLMGDKRFTTFVELKKPTTPLFGSSKNRSNAWRLSTELQDSVSQILEQKASGLIELEAGAFNSEGEPIVQKPYDSKVILIIGAWSELDNSSSTREKSIKMKTFELYRRDSRNVEIMTYDELYERASYIVNSKNVNS